MRLRTWQLFQSSSRLAKRQSAHGIVSSQIRHSSALSRTWSTPLAKNIAEAIATTGPITLAAYMRQCLTSPEGGYYTSKRNSGDQFGQKGDFITSPEISQVFGELVGVWLVAEWIAQGRPEKDVTLIEVGPGRGTLMDDILRTIRNFKPIASSIQAVHLIEASPSLRLTQKNLLCGPDTPLEETEFGYRSTSKYANLSINWVEDIRFLPSSQTSIPFIIAHEFFDALPIHAFQSVATPPSPPSHQIIRSATDLTPPAKSATKTCQWRELLVTPTPPPSILRTTSTNPTTPTPQGADFELTLAPAGTPHSLLLPERSPRYQKLKHNPGSTIEIRPEAQQYMSDIAVRIGGPNSPSNPPKPTHSTNPSLPAQETGTRRKPAGAALILDYGPTSTVPISTLRGIRAHKLVSPFSAAGQVDLSADVDFTALAEAALEASPGVEVHGPVEQGAWLEAMGIWERVRALGGKGVVEAAKRLVGRERGGMGSVYKVMAVVPERGGKRPVGFGGGVEG